MVRKDERIKDVEGSHCQRHLRIVFVCCNSAESVLEGSEVDERRRNDR